MAKVAFSKLNIKEFKDTHIIQFNDIDIEIKKYLPIAEKLELISAAYNNAVSDEVVYDCVIQLNAHLDLQIVFYYTNLTFTDKQKENLGKLYDLLKSSGLIDEIISALGAEYDDLFQGLLSLRNSIKQYRNSARGIMEDITTNYGNMKFDTEELQKNIADPNNLELLKDILTKLG